ncbi:MAG: SDR family NAD(P)-dependent oxidoreductase [Blastocatellia bacterium]
MTRLRDKIALVTGAARGIGESIATRFASEGAQIILADIDEAAGQAAAEAISLRHGGRDSAIFLRADVSQPMDVNDLFTTVVQRFGRLDVLVNNAGISPAAPIAETSAEVFDRVWQVNFRSVFLMTRAAVRLMRGSGGGVILNLASVNGLVAAPGLAVYSATKAAIINFTQATALEYAQDRIRAVAICPASVDTLPLHTKFKLASHL